MKICWCTKWSGSLRRKGIQQRLKHHKIRERFGNLLLCLLLATYAFVGAAVFYAIERPAQVEVVHQHDRDVLVARDSLIENIINATTQQTEASVSMSLNGTLLQLIEGYEATIGCNSLYTQANYHWTYWNAFYYAATIYTTIGFGNLYCRTQAGRILTIFYALFGIPLTLCVLDMIGFRLFSRASRIWRYLKARFDRIRKGYYGRQHARGVSFKKTSHEEFSSQKAQEPDEEALPLSVSFFLVALYIFLISAVFTAVEPSWDYTTSIYFFFVTLSTIGLGDEVPRSEGVGFMLMLACVLIGLALLSMCFNTIQSLAESRYKKALREVLDVLDLSSDCASYISFDRNRLSTEFGLDSSDLMNYRKTYRLSSGTLYDVMSRHSRRSRSGRSSRSRHPSFHVKPRQRIISSAQMAHLRRSIDATNFAHARRSVDATLVAAARTALSGIAERQPTGKFKRHSSNVDLSTKYAVMRKQLQESSKLSASRRISSAVSRTRSVKATPQPILLRKLSASAGDLPNTHDPADSISIIVEADDAEFGRNVTPINMGTIGTCFAERYNSGSGPASPLGSGLSASDLLNALDSGCLTPEESVPPSSSDDEGLQCRNFSYPVPLPSITVTEILSPEELVRCDKL